MLRFQSGELLSLGQILIKLIQRIATRDLPAAGGRGAIAKRAADKFATQWSAGQHVGRQLRIAQRHATQADEVGLPGTQHCLRHVRQPILQVRVAGAHDREIRSMRLSRAVTSSWQATPTNGSSGGK